MADNFEHEVKMAIQSMISDEADAAEPPIKPYACEDCGSQVAIKIVSGPTEPMPHHYLAAGGGDNPFVGCCPICGGTMINDLTLRLPCATTPPIAPEIPSVDDATGTAGEQEAGGVLHRASVVGVVKYFRSDDPSTCVCCPGETHHIFARRVDYEKFDSSYPEHFGYGANEFIGTHTLYGGFEGKRVRLTVEVLADVPEPPEIPDSGGKGQR